MIAFLKRWLRPDPFIQAERDLRADMERRRREARSLAYARLAQLPEGERRERFREAMDA